MPTYEYACNACDHRFEEFQSITAPPLKTCPKCAKKSLQRLIGTGAGVIFKGDGFYTTDYRSEAYRKAAESEKTAAKPESSKSPAGAKDAAAAAPTPASQPTPTATDPPAPSSPKAGGPKSRKKAG